jgi:DNA-binding transcriptional LysR family regulator
MLLDETFAFVQVVHAGSFTAAGRSLGVPKSTLSRQVTRLEEELGAELLLRSTRKLTLTDTGRAYFERCRDALLTLKEAEGLARDDAEIPRGVVRVSMPFDAQGRFGKHLAAFREKYPQVELVVICNQRRTDMLAERIDVAFRGGRLDDSSFVCRKLLSSNVVLCASPDFICRYGEPKTPEELAELPQVMIGDGAQEKLPLIGPDGPAEWGGQPWLIANEWSLILNAILEGGGHGPLLDLDAKPYLEEGRLVRILPEYEIPAGGLYAVYPTKHHLSPKVRALVDFVAERVVPSFGN